jgi:CubicO group peptidase (beta-lactamase class C family)
MPKTLLSSLIVSFLFLPFLLNPAHAASFSSNEIDFDTLDTVIEVQMSKHELPGVAVAVIENDQVIYLKGYGVDGNGDPITPQTQMLIGSQSKSFTALAIAQLAEKGKLDLDAPVQMYIPWFRVVDETASSQITINHLLHHTSGLSDSGFGVLVPNDATLEQAVRSLGKAKLTAPVGVKHQYFNMGYSVLSYIVELTSGESYADYVQENILLPLGMNSSSADVNNISSIPLGYTRFFSFPVPMSESILMYGAGEGFIISTCDDMARYAIAIMNDGSGLVSPEMMKRILTPGPGSYGMGWFIFDSGTKIVHGGANQTFRTEVNIYPNKERAFVLLTNQGYQVDHFISAGQLTNSVEAVILGNTPQSVSHGWSVKWVGWGLAIIVLALLILQIKNFLALRHWKERIRNFSSAKKVRDVAISFIIPTAILIIVFWQVSNFYGNRFNLFTSLAYMPKGMPDVFILVLIGSLPDYIQGIIKIFLLLQKDTKIPAMNQS